jgi:YkoY family integral membrane protein
MFDQSFALSDLPRVGTLSFLEIVLSADNALVLGVIAATLPAPLRKKALFIGIGSAFFLRAAALVFLAYLLKYPWIQLLGAIYLLYLCIRYLIHTKKQPQLNASRSMWKTVFLIEVFDLAFAVDSIMAGLAFINSNFSKIWIVYVGGMIGLFGMRFAADLFSSLLDRFPNLEKSAYLMIGLIGIKLGIAALGASFPPLPFWGLITLLFLLGFFKKKG